MIEKHKNNCCSIMSRKNQVIKRERIRNCVKRKRLISKTNKKWTEKFIMHLLELSALFLWNQLGPKKL